MRRVIKDRHESADVSSRARVKAVELLARREHSVRELERKLARKGINEAVANEVIAGLHRTGLVSDERFTASFIRQRAATGHGPVRIKAELIERGVDVETLEHHLQTAEVDWNASAAALRQRKFGASPPLNFGERAKQSRFLQYRGFTTDQIRQALNSVADESDEFDFSD